MNQRHLFLAWIVSGLAVCTGCSDESRPLVTVEGQVLLDGEPLPAGTVITATESGATARGTIGGDGRFVLETRNIGTGAEPGLHHVAIVAPVQVDPDNPESASRSLVPPSYNNPFNSGLTMDVTPGQANRLKLELSSKSSSRN